MMWLSNQTEAASERDLMVGAWLVETVIVALVLLLIGKLFGIAITFYAFAVCLTLAAALMLLWEFVRRRVGELVTKRRR